MIAAFACAASPGEPVEKPDGEPRTACQAVSQRQARHGKTEDASVAILKFEVRIVSSPGRAGVNQGRVPDQEPDLIIPVMDAPAPASSEGSVSKGRHRAAERLLQP